MKLAVMIINSMILLMFISTVIGEWGQAPAIIAWIGIVGTVINSVFIIIKTKGDFET